MCISGVKNGTVRYYGKTHFAEGEWCGVELEDADGKHDGTVENVRYFTCEKGYGIFAPLSKVELLESSRKRTDENGNSNQSAKSKLVQPKFKSKLSKPKAIVRPLSKEKTRDTEGESSHQSGGIPKPSKPSRLPVKPGHAQESVVRKVKSKSKKESVKNVTFSVDVDKCEDDNFDYEIPEVTTPSRVDAVRALTLAYDLESSGSDSENRAGKQRCMNVTFTKENFDKPQKGKGDHSSKKAGKPESTSSGKQEAGLTSPLPDLLTSATFHAAFEPSDDAGEAMSESEAEEDLEFLSQSNASQTSSLGILGETQLAANSLLTSDFKRQFCRQKSKDSVEISEKELDSEIAGVATPEVQSEVEMSSSTISCDSVQQPNLEIDSVKREQHESASIPSSPAKVLMSKKMASQDPGVLAESDASATAIPRMEGEKIGKLQGNEKEYPGDLGENEDEVDGANITASIELAKAAVSQYADLVQSAEAERANKEARDTEKAAKKARLEELRAKRRSVEMDVDAPGEDHPENVLVELRSGFTGLERPLSTCSTDTGICMDSSITSIESDYRRERPLSLVSSVSTDAGTFPGQLSTFIFFLTLSCQCFRLS